MVQSRNFQKTKNANELFVSQPILTDEIKIILDRYLATDSALMDYATYLNVDISPDSTDVWRE